jgi:hypothetical protein
VGRRDRRAVQCRARRSRATASESRSGTSSTPRQLAASRSIVVTVAAVATSRPIPQVTTGEVCVYKTVGGAPRLPSARRVARLRVLWREGRRLHRDNPKCQTRAKLSRWHMVRSGRVEEYQWCPDIYTYNTYEKQGAQRQRHTNQTQKEKSNSSQGVSCTYRAANVGGEWGRGPSLHVRAESTCMYYADYLPAFREAAFTRAGPCARQNARRQAHRHLRRVRTL